MRVRSVRFKASVLYTFILFLILVLFAGVLYTGVRHALYSNMDNTIRIKAEEIAVIFHTYEEVARIDNTPWATVLKSLRATSGNIGQKALIDDLWRSQFDVLNLKKDYINILNASGRTVISSVNFSSKLFKIFSNQAPFSTDMAYFKTISLDRMKLRVLNLPLTYHGTAYVIQVATPLDAISNTLSNILFFMVASIASILVITSFIGSIFARNALKPVKAVTNLANRITSKELEVRIEEQEADEELQLLVNSFNVMIERLERSFKHINEFSSHVAHELKTPLAILKGEMELALGSDKDTETYKKVLSDCLEEIDRITRIIHDLLLLAKLEYKPDIYDFKRLDLTEFISEIYDHAKLLAARKEIEVSLDMAKNKIYTEADKVHLRRLFLNLINNAVTYTPEKGKIGIAFTHDAAKAYIAISDNGIGISSSDLPRIFDKFFRAHKESASREGGTGLGLSMAISIARAHKGNISVSSEPGKGSVFTVILPVF